jgi:PhnB protein
MHIELAILDGTVLMGTDALESMGHTVHTGNNVTINLEPDTLEETQRLFDALSAGGADVMPLQPMFWGAHWGTCQDRFGVRWMFNFTPVA